MIDFYKHSILSILGKEVGSLTEKEYNKMIVIKYDEYLDKLQKAKLNIKNDEEND